MIKRILFNRFFVSLQLQFMAKTIRTLTTAIALLATGGLTYLLFRPCTLLMFRVIDALGATACLEKCRVWASGPGIQLPEWIIYSLPNALWSAAYILTVEALLKPSRSKVAIAGIMPVAGTVSEWLQAAGVLRGTFDVLDVAAYILPYFAYLAYQTKNSII